MSVEGGLGRRLQLIQGLQWLYGANGDPYATLLRGFDDDLRTVHELLRQQGQLWHSQLETWVSARHSSAAELVDHPALGIRRAPGQPAVQQIITWDEDLAEVDEAEATRLCAVDAGRLRDTYERAIAGLGAEFDVVELAGGVVVAVLADLFALPEERLARGCADAAVAVDALLCPQKLEVTRRLLAALDDLRDVFEGRPVGILHATYGVRLATDLVAKAVHAVLDTPGEWDRLVADPARAAKVVDETVRYDPPVQVHAAIAQSDLEVAGQRVPSGGQVAVVVAAANRDPDVFTDPDRFDPDRQATALVPGGPARLVLPLARAHAEAALRALAAHRPNLSRPAPALRRRRAPVTRGLLRLPVSTD